MAKLIPLGLTSTTAGAIVPLVSDANLATAGGDGFNSIFIQGISGSGPVYILNASTAANVTTYGNILFTITTTAPNVVISSNAMSNDNFVAGLYLSPVTAGHGCVITAKRS